MAKQSMIQREFKKHAMRGELPGLSKASW